MNIARSAVSYLPQLDRVFFVRRLFNYGFNMIINYDPFVIVSLLEEIPCDRVIIIRRFERTYYNCVRRP